MKTMMADELTGLVSEIFQRRGVPKDDSLIVSKSLVHANLRGVDSHGVMRVGNYVQRLEAGSTNSTPRPLLEPTGKVTAFLDGDNGLGQISVWHAMSRAIGIAKEYGLSLVGIRNSNHCGALSFYAFQAIGEGLIGLVMTQTDSGVVPYGGRKPFCGTNPLCFGIPSSTEQAIILDMATSTVAAGHIYKARSENREIPNTWAVDKEGKPTTNPHDAVYFTPSGGPKGYGLGVVIDILTGILMGGNFGPQIPLMYGDYERKRGLCHLVGAIDYRRYPGKESFLSGVRRMVEQLHQVPTAEGFSSVLAPGEPEYLEMERRQESGIPIEDHMWDELVQLHSG
jgi:ureidoglycolate dehydrogenase (NAD+)